MGLGMSIDLLEDSRPLLSVVSKDHSILRHSIYDSIPFFDGRLYVVIEVRESGIESPLVLIAVCVVRRNHSHGG